MTVSYRREVALKRAIAMSASRTFIRSGVRLMCNFLLKNGAVAVAETKTRLFEDDRRFKTMESDGSEVSFQRFSGIK